MSGRVGIAVVYALGALLAAALVRLARSQSTAVGVNIKIPIPVISDLFDSDTPHQRRWYFWVIIGVIACFLFVITYFTARGFVRYRHMYRKRPSHEVDTGDAMRRTAGVQNRMRTLIKYNPRYACSKLEDV